MSLTLPLGPRPEPSPTLCPQVVLPVNGDPFIGMLETPVTSSPLVAGFLSNLPAYRTQVSPLLRGVEIGLAHGFLLVRKFDACSPPTPSLVLVWFRACVSRHWYGATFRWGRVACARFERRAPRTWRGPGLQASAALVSEADALFVGRDVTQRGRGQQWCPQMHSPGRDASAPVSHGSHLG